MDLLSGLNDVQKEIVKDTEGQLLVLAGAGSGKTRVLTHRVAYLLDNNVPAWQILAVTFTNKAAREMRERLVALSGQKAKDVWMGTFHGICLRILARFGSEIGFEKFTIIDDKEQEKAIKEVMALIGTEYDAKDVLASISNAKNALMSPDEFLTEAKRQQEKDVAHIYQAYEEHKAKHGYLDFDDLIMKTVHLFNVCEKARNTYQKQFRYILTDETQDTNKAQFQLLVQLSGEHENIFAVGDTDQSIYGWRGAEISNIMNFQNYFPEVKVYRLEQNYRSTQTIVNASNAIIANNKIRLEKTAFSKGEVGKPIVLHTADSDAREADFVADIIKATQRREGRRWDEFAVLYRTNRQSRAIEAALIQKNIPYQVVGGTNFYDRKEIKDIVSYLRAISNGVDYIAFERIVNVPRRGVGDTTLEKIRDYANECGIPFPTALEHVDNIPKVSKKAKAGIESFLESIGKFREYASSEDFFVAELLIQIIELTGYKAMLQESGKEDDESRLENIQELINVAARWDADEDNAGKTLGDFLAETSLVSDVDTMESDDKVTLMTGHACKGLEFAIVFIVGLEERILPHVRSLIDSSEMEEERRLFYVMMTRAEEKLYLSHCKYRFDYGSSTPNASQPSRFLRELPSELVKRS